MKEPLFSMHTTKPKKTPEIKRPPVHMPLDLTNTILTLPYMSLAHTERKTFKLKEGSLFSPKTTETNTQTSVCKCAVKADLSPLARDSHYQAI